MPKEKPMLNFEDLFKHMEKMDAVEFKEKYGIEKQQAKGILDSMWLDKLANFDKVFDIYKEFFSKYVKEIKEVELFEPGHHNGKTFTEKDIDNILKATKKIVGEQNLQIPIKLGHSDEQNVAKQLFGEDTKGMPALGWVKNIKKKGKKLVGDLVDIPEKLYKMLEEKMWNARSVELWEGFVSSKGDNVGTVLTGLALLGAETPAVTSLETLFDKEGEIKSYSVEADKTKGEIKMPEEIKKEEVVPAAEKVEETVVPETVTPEQEEAKKVEEAKKIEETKKAEELARKEKEETDEVLKNVKELARKYPDLEQLDSKISEMKLRADEGAQAIKDLGEAKKSRNDFEKQIVEEKDSKFLKEMGENGNLLPFQVEYLKPLFRELDSEKEVTYFDKGLEVDKTIKLKGLVVNFIKSLLNQVEFQEFSKTHGKDLSTDLDAAAKKYAKEHKVDLGDAYKVVAKELGRSDEL